MKSFNKKFNAKRAAESLAKKFPAFAAVTPIEESKGVFFPALTIDRVALKALGNKVPDEIKDAAYVNGADMGQAETAPVAQATSGDKPKQPKAERPTAAATQDADTPHAARAGSKREIVANLLLRSGGATTKEILTATGWKALNIPGTARALGITVQQVKEGRNTTYIGTRV